MLKIADNASPRWLPPATVLTAALLVALNVTRILHVPLTYDESEVGVMYSQSFSDIFLHFAGTANNHLLNTFFEKLFISLLGDNIFALRAGNLLGQLLFLCFSFAVSKRLFHRPLVQYCVFLLLNLQPFLFEFWGLARGYGMAVGFMSGSLYFVLRFLATRRLAPLALSLAFAVLAVLASFTLLNFYCGVVAVAGGALLLSKRRVQTYGQAAGWVIILAFSALLYLATREPLSQLVATKQLFYGGAHGFVDDTVRSLLVADLYTRPIMPVTIASYALAAGFVLCGIWWLVWWKKGEANAATGAAVWLLAAIPVAAVIAQFHVLHTPYLLDRTALFLIPLHVLHFAYWMSTAFSRRPSIASGLLCGLAVLSAFNFGRNVDTRTTQIWHTDAFNVDMLNRVTSAPHLHPIKLCVFWIFTPSINYYVAHQYRDKLPPVRETGHAVFTDTSFDYYYIPLANRQQVPPQYVVDTIYPGGQFFMPGSDYYLLRKK